jgi:hypothetical protein
MMDPAMCCAETAKVCGDEHVIPAALGAVHIPDNVWIVPPAPRLLPEGLRSEPGKTMSLKKVQLIVGRLVTDESYRFRFLGDPIGTLRVLREQGVELTAAEIEVLLRTDQTLWTDAADRIDAHLQRSNLRNDELRLDLDAYEAAGAAGSQSPNAASRGSRARRSLEPHLSSTADRRVCDPAVVHSHRRGPTIYTLTALGLYYQIPFRRIRGAVHLHRPSSSDVHALHLPTLDAGIEPDLHVRHYGS